MPFQAQLGAAIAAVKTYVQADTLGREIWRAYAAGLLSDNAAQAAAEAVEAKKKELRDNPPAPIRKPLVRLPRRPAPRSPDRAVSIARRRRCAASGALPASLAASFTLSETAVLATIAGEIRRKGFCDMCNDALAAKSGVCRTVVQNTLREAKALGLIHVQERPRRGAKNLSNVVTVVSPVWRQWLKLGGNRMQKSERHGKQEFKTSQQSGNRSERLSDGRSGEASPPRPGARGPREPNARLGTALAGRAG